MQPSISSLISVAAAFALSGIGMAQQTTQPASPVPTGKSELRVLFVGHDPEAPQGMFADMDDPRVRELYRERTGAFQSLLEDRFEHVQVVYGADYTASLSDSVDVTIFDARPKALKEAVRENDPTTGEMIYEPAEYLPLNFDRPAVLIASSAPTIGEPLGLKLDWL